MIQSRATKRQKIVYAVIASALTMLLALQFPMAADWTLLVLLAIVYVGTIMSLDCDLHHEEWVVLPLYALLVTVIVFTAASQFATSPLNLIISSIVYGVIMYGLLLTLNILNVATIRPIPLARAASTVLSMSGLATSFGMFYLTLINQPSIGEWMAYVGSIAFLVAWPLVWTSMGNKQRLPRSLAWSFLAAALLTQLAGISSFWPNSFMSSLFLSVVLFLILGMVHLQEKRLLTQKTKQQYLILGGAVVVMFYMFTQW